MPYVSSTLRMSVSNAIDGSLARWDMHNNDAPATVDTAGYITDARQKGMQVGDIVTYLQWTNAPTAFVVNRGVDRSLAGALVGITEHVVLSIAANGSANLSDGRALTMTNTD